MLLLYFKRFLIYEFVSTIGGFLMGMVIAAISFPLANSSMEFGMGFGAPMGIFIGLLFGLLSFWPLRKENMEKIFWMLAIFSFGGGVLSILGGVYLGYKEGAPFISWFGTMLGYWIGVIVVGLENPFKSRNAPRELLKEDMLSEGDGDVSQR